jgi:opacity protein-like surface antigen
VTIPYTRSLIDGQFLRGYEWGRIATQLLGGVAWNLSPRWDASLEYKLTATTIDGSVAEGDSLSSLRTHHLVFGLGFQFRR